MAQKSVRPLQGNGMAAISKKKIFLKRLGRFSEINFLLRDFSIEKIYKIQNDTNNINVWSNFKKQSQEVFIFGMAAMPFLCRDPFFHQNIIP